MKIELKITINLTTSYITNSNSASPPKFFVDGHQSLIRSPESPHGASLAGFFVPLLRLTRPPPLTLDKNTV